MGLCRGRRDAENLWHRGWRLVLCLSLGVATPVIGLAADKLVELGSFGAPSWVTMPDWTIESTQNKYVSRQQGHTVMVTEHKPKGQADRNWSQRHWMTFFPSANPDLKVIMRSILRSEGDRCATKSRYFDDVKDSRNLFFFFECGRRKDDGLGRMGVVYLGRASDGTVVRVSEEWRGRAYDVNKPETRFFPNTAVQKIIRNLTRTRLK